MKIISRTCVNSKWTADFLGKKGEECCQCVGSCKVKVRYHGYEYILNKQEIDKLEKENEKENK